VRQSSSPLAVRVLGVALVAALLTGALSWQPARAEQIIHVVQPGENLFRIGLKYGVSWTALMEANGLTDTTIYVGQRLIIPLGDDAPAAASPSPADSAPGPASPPPTESAPAAPPAPTSASSTTYVIQRGDTLFNIATRYSLTVDQLAAANGIANPSLIHTGQTLAIPSSSRFAAPGADSNLTSAPLASTGGGKYVLIDISEQHMYVYEGDVLVYSFVASTGEPGRATAPGLYSVLDKIPNAYASTWDLWMPNWLGIYWAGRLENGIHALPFQSNGWRLWDGYLGTPVSYGCVILGVNESQLLYDWTEVGTTVEIRW
jgi:LysM repeat protein